MKKALILLFALTLVLGTVDIAKADFMIDPNPGGEDFFLDNMKDVTDFSGHVGNQVLGPLVNIHTDVLVDVSSGGATIKPSTDAILTSVLFTPADKTLFGDFSFRGQLLEEGDITLTVTDGAGEVFTFHAIKMADFGPFGIIAEPGSSETIKSVLIESDGFKQSKQFEFSYAAVPVPEPGILILLGIAMSAIGAASWKIRKI